MNKRNGTFRAFVQQCALLVASLFLIETTRASRKRGAFASVADGTNKRSLTHTHALLSACC